MTAQTLLPLRKGRPARLGLPAVDAGSVSARLAFPVLVVALLGCALGYLAVAVLLVRGTLALL